MENGAISDGQISASSQLDSSHAVNQARLHFKATASKAGSWSARSNDVNQWFQIDLGSRHTNATRVATQGRNDSLQWVTKFKLQYSNNGVNFPHYKQQGQTAAKVKALSTQLTAYKFFFLAFHTSFKAKGICLLVGRRLNAAFSGGL